MALDDAQRLQMVAMALMRHSVVGGGGAPAESLIKYYKKYTPRDYLAIVKSHDLYDPDETYGQSYIESSEYSSTYTASKAFDDVGNTYWRPFGTAAGEYVGVDFGSGKTIGLVAITYYSPYGMSNIIIQGSNGATVWDDLLTTTSIYNTAVKQYFVLGNANSYRYYRIYNNSTTIGASIRVYEIEMMEEA